MSDGRADARWWLPIGWVSAARRWREGGSGGVESGRYLAKWTILAVLIGVVAGVGALVFYRAIGFVNAHLLGALAGVHPPEPLGEGGDATLRPFGRPWLVPVIAALGGLASGLLVFTLAPEAEGHGTDAAIAAFHHKAGQIRARIAPIKLVASAITIGSGGSAGREGPAAQISATFGSVLADLLGLSAADRRLCVAVGMGAGIGAIFRAPLGGAMLAAEILYVHDMETEALIPSLIAAITGYAIFGAFTGWEPIFGAQPGIVFDQPVQLLYFALLGLLCGGVGILYARGFYGIEHLFQKLPLPRIVKPAIGGLLVGLLALVMPQVLGTGYGWVQLGLDQRLLDLPLWVVLLLPFAKILTTGLPLDEALDSLASADLSWAPALDADGERLAGLISVPGIVAAYRAGLARDVRRADGLATGMTLLEVQVRPGSPLLAGPLRDLPLPAGVLLVARRRGEVVHTPRGDTAFAPGDVVTVLTSLAEEAATRRFFAARGAQ